MNKNFGFSQMGNPFTSMCGMAGGLGNAAMAYHRQGAMEDKAKFYAAMNARPKAVTTIEMEKDAHGVYRAA